MLIFSCGMWDLVPPQGMEPSPLHWEHGVLATGPPEKSLRFTSEKKRNSFKLIMCFMYHEKIPEPDGQGSNPSSIPKT